MPGGARPKSLVETTLRTDRSTTREQLMTTTATSNLISMPPGAGQEAVVRPAIDGFVPVCDCGQALDACPASHCPRCGVTIVKLCRPGRPR